jgi:hypothetical protein
VLKPGTHQEILVDSIPPVEREKLIDEECEFQLSEKECACAQQQEKNHLSHRNGNLGHGKNIHTPLQKKFDPKSLVIYL